MHEINELKAILFENCEFWENAYEETSKSFGKLSFQAERNYLRYFALYDVITEANLEKEFEVWKEQNK